MKKIITILLLSTVAVTAVPKVKIHHVQQKKTEVGRLYGSRGGIYFSYTNLEPLILYSLQYSSDMKTWTNLYNFGVFGDSTTSPLFDWYKLPSEKCFFRIIKNW